MHIRSVIKLDMLSQAEWMGTLFISMNKIAIGIHSYKNEVNN
jgi:hypothetical protein